VSGNFHSSRSAHMGKCNRSDAVNSGTAVASLVVLRTKNVFFSFVNTQCCEFLIAVSVRSLEY